MERINWIGLTIFISLATFMFGIGHWYASLDNPQDYGYPKYRYSSQQPSEVLPPLSTMPATQPFEYRHPCQNPDGESESQLCADWRAAKASESSASWTKWGVIVAAIGSTLLLVQIRMTLRALDETSDATKAMIDQNILAEQAQRAWIIPTPSFENILVRDGKIHAACQMSYFNAGATVARNVRYFAAFWPTDPSSDAAIEDWRKDWASQDTEELRQYSLAPGERFEPKIPLHKPLAELPWVEDGNRRSITLFFLIVVFYDTVCKAEGTTRRTIQRAHRIGLQKQDEQELIFYDSITDGGGEYGVVSNPAGTAKTT